MSWEFAWFGSLLSEENKTNTLKQNQKHKTKGILHFIFPALQ